MYESSDPTFILCSRSNLDSALLKGGGDFGGELMLELSEYLQTCRPTLPWLVISPAVQAGVFAAKGPNVGVVV